MTSSNTRKTSASFLRGVGQVSRTVGDFQRAKVWYQEVLGLELLYAFPAMAFFLCGQVRLYLREGALAGDSVLYFSVEDIHATQRALESRGVRFTQPARLIHRHEDGTEEWMAFFEDLDGQVLALMGNAGGAP